MKGYAFSAVVLGLVLSAGSRGDNAEKENAERKALAGKWVCESSEVNGVKRGTKESKGQSFTFDGEKCIQDDAALGDRFEGTYQLDLSGKQKALSMKLKVGTRDLTIPYIFDRDGDTLKLCGYLLPGKGLPTEFSAPEGSKRMYAVFKRDKE
jgi:uncharacterized protein (TIGR03067 family)